MGEHDFSDLSYFSVDVLAELQHRGLYDPETEDWDDLLDEERRAKLLDLYSALQEIFDGPIGELASFDDLDEVGSCVLGELEGHYLYDPEVERWEEMPVDDQRERLKALFGSPMRLEKLHVLYEELEDFLRTGLAAAAGHQSRSSSATAHGFIHSMTEPSTTGDQGRSSSAPTRLALEVLDTTVAQLPNGEVREGQQRMCELVATTLASGERCDAEDNQSRQTHSTVEGQSAKAQHLAVQAGTGIGKTFAYGVPAALSHGRVVVATATKALQDQLNNDDMPSIVEAVRSVTGKTPSVAVLKGRENYFCRKRIQQLRDDGRDQEGTLRHLIDAATHSKTGDKAYLDFEPDADAWRHVSVSSAECLGKDRCQFGESCFTEVAREAAWEASVVIVNHALYSLYLSRGDNILPPHEAVVIDEAHQFLHSVQSIADITISQDTIETVATLARGKSQPEAIERLRAGALELSDAILDRNKDQLAVPHGEIRRGNSRLALALSSLSARLTDLQKAVNENLQLALELDDLDDPSEHDMLSNLIDDAIDDFREIEREVNSGEEPALGFCAYVPKTGVPTFSGVRLSVRDFVSERINDVPVLLTSATLDEDLIGELGIEKQCYYETLESPFDYATHSLLYLPRRPLTWSETPGNTSAYTVIRRLLSSCTGGALILFTSWDRLNGTVLELSEPESSGDCDVSAIKVYKQGGEYTNAHLVHKLRTEPGTVVCATKTFWHGVDLRGDALHLLIIDKMPFPVYSIPPHVVLEAHLKAHGRSGFDELSVPQAARELAQGLGRLIRTTTDRGVAAVLDSRLATADYGPRVLALAPSMRLTHDLAEATSFLEEISRT